MHQSQNMHFKKEILPDLKLQINPKTNVNEKL